MKPFVAALAVVVAAGCAAPSPSISTDRPSPTTFATVAPSPSSGNSVVFECVSADYCADPSKKALLAAVAGLGYTVKSVSIGPWDLSCGGPFPSGVYSCPLATDPLPTAYVTFADTDKVAVVEVGTVLGGPGVDSVVAFKIPPSGWSLP